MKRKLGLIFCFLLSLTIIAKAEETREWKHVNGNPNGFPISQVIDSLDVPREVRDNWHTLVDSEKFNETYRYKGEVLYQLTFGGKLPGTKYECWDSTLCNWQGVDSLKTKEYTSIYFDTLRTKAKTKVYMGVWTLCVFDTCQNVAWDFIGSKYVITSIEPRQTLTIEIKERARKRGREIKKYCPSIELENFVSFGKNGHYGYFSEGARFIFYPCTYPYVGLTAKAIFSWMPPYESDPAYAKQSGVSFKNLKENTNVEIGVRLHLPREFNITLYGYLGKQRYDYVWRDGLIYEGELLLKYKRFLFEQIIVEQSDVDYLWSRSRVKLHVWSYDSGELRLGGEHYYEGNDYFKKPLYYYTRTGVLGEWFQSFGKNNWWSAVAHTGYGTFGWYVGAEFNVGTGVIPVR